MLYIPRVLFLVTVLGHSSLLSVLKPSSLSSAESSFLPFSPRLLLSLRSTMPPSRTSRPSQRRPDPLLSSSALVVQSLDPSSGPVVRSSTSLSSLSASHLS